MKNKILKSLSDLSILKKELNNSVNKDANANKIVKIDYEDNLNQALHKEKINLWLPINKLLSNKLFEEIAWGTVNSISSKNYSVVLAVLTYPKIADRNIRQVDLDKAHDIALRIKNGFKSGRVKYTDAKIPKPWRISGNPGTRK